MQDAACVWMIILLLRLHYAFRIQKGFKCKYIFSELEDNFVNFLADSYDLGWCYLGILKN